MEVIALQLQHPIEQDSAAAGPPAIEMAASLMQTAAQYAVETDASATKLFRSHVDTITAQLRENSPSALGTTVASVLSDFRGAIRAYRDQTSAYVDRLRQELVSTSEALAGLLTGVQSGSSESDRMLAQEVSKIRGLAQCDSIADIRVGLEKSTQSLTQYADRMRREKDAIIAQLQSEIQTLHRSLDEAQRASRANAVTGMMSKDDFIRLVRRKMIGGERIGVIHIALRNLHELSGEFPDSARQELVIAFSRRMKNVIPPTANPGEWGDAVFCIVAPDSTVGPTSVRLESACSGRYVLMCNGSTRKFELRASITPILPVSSDDSETLFARLHELDNS